jgi:hypothetical protein
MILIVYEKLWYFIKTCVNATVSSSLMCLNFKEVNIYERGK